MNLTASIILFDFWVGEDGIYYIYVLAILVLFVFQNITTDIV